MTTKCVITITHPLLKFTTGEESPSNLFVGIGTEPFDKNVDNYLHPVINLTHEPSNVIAALYTIAIVMVSRLKEPITGLIPVVGLVELLLQINSKLHCKYEILFVSTQHRIIIHLRRRSFL